MDLNIEINKIASDLILKLKNKDIATAFHSQNVGNIVADFGPTVSDIDKQTLYLAGLLHDIGKIAIPKDILAYTGKYTDRDMAVMMIHPQISYKILKRYGFPEIILDAVLYHHENCDGTGYYNLKDTEIPYIAKIIRIVDPFDALTNFRPYRDPVNYKEALYIMGKENGKYDKNIFHVFKKYIKKSIEMSRL